MNALLTLLLLVAAWFGRADEDPMCFVLGGLDTVRAEAFVRGEPERLDHVYVDARAARPDAAMLRAYRERGLDLRGMLLERRECRVRSRDADLVVLDVVDRLAPTAVRAPDGSWRDLPRDEWSRHTVVLRRVRDAWRVGSVSSPRSSRR